MQLNKAVGDPLVIGILAGIGIVVASEAHFLIPVGGDTSAGIGEIFTTLSAAAGGPVAVFIELLIAYGGVAILHPGLLPDLQSQQIYLADAVSHLLAMLVLAGCYSKLLYPRAKGSAAFIAGWWLTISVYYYLALFPLAVVLLSLANPNYDQTYLSIARDLFPEFLATTVITSLIWFASPAYFRRPRWLKPQQTPEQLGELQQQGNIGTP